jgi:hypothetical protein
MAAVEAMLALDSQPWRPEVGDQIAGTLRAIAIRSSSHTDNYPVLTIETAGGSCFDVHAFHTVLWDEIRQQQPRVGDVVGVKYLGRRAGGQGDGYEAYRLAVVHLEESAPVGDPAVTGPGEDARHALPSADPVRAADQGSSSPAPQPSPEATADELEPVLPSAHRRIELYHEVAAAAEAAGLKPAGAINTAVGGRFTATSAPASATIDELERTLAWLENGRRG